MNLKRGDVVLIVATGELGKPRPAVVVQSDALEQTTSILVCPMSSDLEKAEHVRPIVEPSAGNGVRLRSQMMTDKLVALGRKRVRRLIGRLEAKDGEALDQALLFVLGLAR